MSRANQASVTGLSIENCPRLWLATSEEPGRTIPHAVLLLDAAALLVRDFEEMSSKFETAGCELAPCISRPSTGRLRTRASAVRHGSGTRPTAGFPCSSAGSDHAGHDRSSAAL